MTQATEQKRPETTLGERIAELRKKHNYTQEEFSQLLGITAQAVSKWENGVSCPDIMLLPKLSQLLGVTIDELMGVKPIADEKPRDQAEAVQSAQHFTIPQTELKKLKVRLHIIDNKGKHFNVTLPVSFVLRATGMGIKISTILGNSAISDVQTEQILNLLKSGATGEVFDFCGEDGTKITIEIS